MNEPRRVDFTLTDYGRLTLVEVARACALADVGPYESDELVRGIAEKRLTGAEFLRGVQLITAMAWQFLLRTEPALTYADALGWDLHFVEGPPDRQAEIEADVTVKAALLTGLPPREAGELTVSQAEAYGRALAARDGQ